ncbi:DUF222 domain-containing protein [Blastococcus brunescens]|uniref:DUF222 domain-containing protein n=1 Tax=Blastococcus brunescens TaxID=1564165 RepID=A0ABZ1AYX9_9ACTN|nr:hypothetical protein [Blastococcus sp. BMG 8361]WRL63759.1 hypothetical protein U6N30_29640 [Blastococcus sp. BMG 8361]
MQQTVDASPVEELLAGWLAVQPEPVSRLPARLLDDERVAEELGRIQRNRAREAAREAELILRLAELRPDGEDPAPGTPGARRGWRRTDPEFAGVSEFFPDEVAHAINLGRGRRRCGRGGRSRGGTGCRRRSPRWPGGDRRAAGLGAGRCAAAQPAGGGRRGGGVLLPGAGDLSVARLRARALELLAELDADAVGQRHEEAQRAADVRCADAGDGMATLSTDLPVAEAAACYDVIDQLAAMAKADGDPRPIGAIRAAIHAMLILRPADSGLPGVTVNLAVSAALEGWRAPRPAAGRSTGSVSAPPSCATCCAGWAPWACRPPRAGR